MKKVLRVLVCGSTFGQFYLEGLRLWPERFSCAGLLAAGSERSRLCAQEYGIPLFTCLEEVPDDVDLACVVLRSGVMGGQGTDLSLRLLQRGVSVLQEQPVHYRDWSDCLRAARKHNVRFHVGSLYRHLPAVRRFAACVQALAKEQALLFVEAAFASQVSYPLVEMLGQSLPSLRPFEKGDLQTGPGPFYTLGGRMGGVPVTLRVHQEVDPQDPDNHLHLLQRIAVGVAGGTLTLQDPHGPLFWQPRMYFPKDKQVMRQIQTDSLSVLAQKQISFLQWEEPRSYQEIFTDLWPRAIAEDLHSMAFLMEDNGAFAAQAQQGLSGARLWQEITEAIGYPVLRPGQSYAGISLEYLQTAAAGACPVPAKDTLTAVKQLEDCGQPGEAELGELSRQEVQEFVKHLDRAVLESMLQQLQQQKLLLPGQVCDLPKLMSVMGARTAYRGLMRRWLHVLSERGYVDACGGHYQLAKQPLQRELEKSWQEVRRRWDGRLGSPLVMEYLHKHVPLLPQLWRGEQQAALLLFPQGEWKYAKALYGDTVIARYLNRAVAEAVAYLAQSCLEQKRQGSSFRVVEIGGGTGATTCQVVPRLRAYQDKLQLSYLFTDLSSFFLGQAEKEYADYPWLHCRVLDIDQKTSVEELGQEPADVIIAAGVLNNARNTQTVIQQLMAALKPQGWLLMTEPMREFTEILISQAFMMTHPDDERQKQDTTFLTLPQWRQVFLQEPVDKILVFPSDEHVLAPFGQKLMAVRRA